ncbi:MAG: PAS domain S-box protein [Bacteroidales bacterium]|nr:PAS domain S-box protein [Bacteroidales bacterium]
MIRIDLLYNLAVLVSISVLSGFVDNRWKRDLWSGKLLQGILFGLAVIIGMMYPIRLFEGLIFDGRSIVISLATLYFGPVTGIITALFAVMYRFYIGGIGTTMGISVITASLVIGYVFYLVWKKNAPGKKVSAGKLYLMGILVHIAMLSLILTLPSNFRSDTLQLVGMTVIGAYPIVTVLIGKILQDQELNRHLFNQVSENEELFRTTFYSIGDAVITTDRLGNIRQMNRIAEELTGFTESEARYQPLENVFRIVNETTGEKVENPVEKVLESGNNVELANHTVLITKKGLRIPIADSGAPIINQKNEISGVVLVFRDQRKERKARIDLMKSVESYKGLFNSIANAIYIQDKAGRFIDVNEGAIAMYGYSREEFLGKQPDFLSAPGMNDLDMVREKFVEAFNGSPQTFEFWGIKNDGAIFPKEVQLYRTSYFGNEAVIAIAQDISERRKADKALRENEEKYRMLVTHQNDLVVKVDHEGKFVYVSPSYCKLFNKQESELIGQSFTPLIFEEDRQSTREAMKLLEVPPHACYLEQRVITENGMRWLGWSDTAIVDESGKITAIIGVGRDVTDRVIAQLKLSESEKRYRLLFDASPIGILLEDSSGLILDVNKTLCEQYGYQREELIGQSVEILALDENKPDVSSNIETIIKNKVLESTIRGKTKNGNIIIAQLIETTIKMADGKQGILSISKDITNQVRTEESLVATEARNKAIISAIPDIIFRFDRGSHFIDCIAKAPDLLALEPEKFVGKDVADVMTPELAGMTKTNIAYCLESGQLLQYEYSLMIGDQEHWFDARMVPSGTDEVLVIVRDITARKKSEVELEQKSRFIETLLDSVPNPLFYMDTKGIYLGVNKAFKAYYMLDDEDIIGKSIFDIDPLSDAARNYESDRRILEGLDQHQVLEREITLKNGETRNVIITKSPFPDTQHKIGGMIGMMLDITSRTRMEHELYEAKEKAEESDKLKTSFLNNLSHEIRTPLNAIVGFADLLFEDYSDTQKRQFVETINSNSEQLLRIIDDVLVVSRLDSEKIPVEKNEFNPRRLFEDLYMTFNPDAERVGLVLSKPQISLHLPKMIVGDKAKIRQVLSGFIGNAIKYTQFGHIDFGGKVEHGRLHCYVTDTGMGIPENEQAFIFNRFFRSTHAQMKAIRGNGLGLSIAKGLVELMGGNIGLTSTEGQGSTFFFDIPLIEANTIGDPVAKQEWSDGPGFLKDICILIAEDENDNFELVASMLSPRVKRIDRAFTGSEAVEMVKHTEYDLVLMDIKMPVMDGIRATKLIRTLDQHLPVIAQSAYSQQEDIKAAISAGCNDYIIKPISKSNLYDIIILHCQNRQA